MKPNVVLKTNLPELKLFSRGKVRDIYDVPPYLLIVTSDRISAFDVILPNGIPYKGQVLTALSTFWFDFVKDITPTHFITADFTEITRLVKGPPDGKAGEAGLEKYESILKGRTMLVKKTRVFPVECVVRGYLAGSGWKEYQHNGLVSGVKLPTGLGESAKLNEPIFTPATKATSGHDENITFERMKEVINPGIAEQLKERSFKIYQEAHKYALDRGVIISDTKFEWGQLGEEIILVDEILTPDSSRFWPQDKYSPGRSQPSFDKQFVRDYLLSIKWDKNPPAPELPEPIIQQTSEKYLEAYRRLTGQKLV